MTAEDKKTCFIAMPITTHEDEAERYNGDSAHWDHVMETIFVPAIEKAGFTPVRPAAVGAHMIHGQIIRHLSTADMVLCDLSGHNPNVFFELGVRTSLNLPVALVRDEHTGIPFDTSGLNTHSYSSTLNAWDTKREVERLAQHLADSAESCEGSNPMWRHFGLTIAADAPSVEGSSSDARLELITESLNDMRVEMSKLNSAVAAASAPDSPAGDTSAPAGGMRIIRDTLAEIAPATGANPVVLSRSASGLYRAVLEKKSSVLPFAEISAAISDALAARGYRVESVEDEGDTIRVMVDPRRRMRPMG
ncbi:hypothetical protein [Microbacterium testaceum]|uniref:hypothetical protein n=1 Tax=Microbacterium testaceum TaxID=2033 RepID=UPI002435F2BA|nr:hypothetical protein [Microbacterium testaceum]